MRASQRGERRGRRRSAYHSHAIRFKSGGLDELADADGFLRNLEGEGRAQFGFGRAVAREAVGNGELPNAARPKRRMSLASALPKRREGVRTGCEATAAR